MGCKGGDMKYSIQEKTSSGYWFEVLFGNEKDVIDFVNANSSDTFRRMTNINECMRWFYIEREQYRLLKVCKETQVKNGF